MKRRRVFVKKQWTPVISMQRTLHNIQIMYFNSNTKYDISSLIRYQIYYSTVTFTIETRVRRISLKKVNVKRMSF